MRRLIGVLLNSGFASFLLLMGSLSAQETNGVAQGEVAQGEVDSSIQLALIPITSTESTVATAVISRHVLSPKTSESPIGTGIRSDLQARVHVGDQPNLITQLTKTSRPIPLAARPLDERVPLRDPEPTLSLAKPVTKAVELPMPNQRRSLMTPQLSVAVEGPEKLVADSEATYTIDVENKGENTATNVVLDIAFSKNVVITRSNKEPEISPSIYRFSMGEVEAGKTTQLKLRLQAKETGAIELATRLSSSTMAPWNLSVVPSDGSSLEVKVEGVDRVNVGESTDQKITLTNRSSSVIESMELQVKTPDHLRIAEEQSLSIEVGKLPEGESRTFVIKSVAKHASSNPMEVAVLIDGEVVHRQEKSIQVDEEKIALAITGPLTAVSEEPATFGLELFNLTEEASEKLAVQLLVPASMKVMTLDRAADYDAKKNLLIWQIDPLRPNERVVLRLKAMPGKPGTETLKAQVNNAKKVMVQERMSVQVAEAVDDNLLLDR